MTGDVLVALFGFALVSTGTPGPNNMMLLASGANHGLRRTIPHMVGIWTGLASMLIGCGLGLGQVFVLWPAGYRALQVAATLYLLWLAWKIATAASPTGATARPPLTLLEAAGFQWVNPKAWAMALTAVSVYVPAPGVVGVAAAIVAFTVAAAFCNTLWTLAGQHIAKALSSPMRLRVFNGGMAALLVLSLWPILRA